GPCEQRRSACIDDVVSGTAVYGGVADSSCTRNLVVSTAAVEPWKAQGMINRGECVVRIAAVDIDKVVSQERFARMVTQSSIRRVGKPARVRTLLHVDPCRLWVGAIGRTGRGGQYDLELARREISDGQLAIDDQRSRAGCISHELVAHAFAVD